MVAQKNCTSRNTTLLCNLDNWLCGHDGAASAAEGTVRDDVDALVVAKVDNFLLRKRGMILDLVDGWDSLGLGEQLLEILLAVLQGC